MTIASTTSRNDYTGNGVTDTFAYNFKVFDENDLLVTLRDTTGVETAQTIITDYAVTGVGEATGGNVVFVTAPTLDYGVTIRRVVDLLQETDIRNQGPFYAEAHENEFDYRNMIDLQQQDEIGRCYKLPETEAGTAAKTVLPYATDRASKYFAWDVNGDPIASDGGAVGYLYNISPFMETVLDDTTAAAARTTLGISLTNLGISAYAQTLLDDADASAAQTTLGISNFIKTLLNDADSATARATLEISQTNLGITAFAQTILDDADAAAVRATIGVSTGDPTLYKVELNSAVSNGGSATYVPCSGCSLTGMTSGTYLFQFCASYLAAAGGGVQMYAIHQDGVEITTSTRTISTTGSADNTIVTAAVLTVTPASVVDVKWKTDTGPDTLNERTFTALRVTVAP
jgi:hypothetical protein